MQLGVVYIQSNLRDFLNFRKAKKSHPDGHKAAYNPDYEDWKNDEFWENKSEFEDTTNEHLHRYYRGWDSSSENTPNSPSRVKGEDVHVMVDLSIEDLIHGKTTEVKYDCRLQCSH